MPVPVFVERRRAERYPVDIPIHLRTGERVHHARTVDVSAEGLAAVIVAGATIAEGETLQFSITLHHLDVENGSLLEGSATVVRVQASADTLVVAIRAQCLSTFPLAVGIPVGCPS